MTHTAPDAAPVSRTRAGRLPVAVRRALGDLEQQHAHGDDDAYAAALGRLTNLAGTLSERQRMNLNAALASRAQMAQEREFTTLVRGALAAGNFTTVAHLPGGVEVIEVATPDLTQLLVTLPEPLEGDSAPVRDLVARARDAIVAGVCPHCRGALRAGASEQMTVMHKHGCPVSERSLERARRRHP